MTTNPLRVLLADDDDDDCFFFSQILASLPVATTLTVVGNGEQLMNELRRQHTTLPDLLFIDLNMPLLNGYECLAAIKSDPQLVQLPVIILSTFIAPPVEEKLYALGAAHCIQKPTDFNQLEAVIGEVIARFVAATDAPPRGNEGKPTTDAVADAV